MRSPSRHFLSFFSFSFLPPRVPPAADFHCKTDDAEDMVKATRDACYPGPPGSDPAKWRSSVEKVKHVLVSAHRRAAACADPSTATPRSPWTAPEKTPRAFGVKNAAFLVHLPTIRAAAAELGLASVTLVHVVRDGRDHFSGGNEQDGRRWSELGFGGSGGAEGVATWVAANLAVKTCGERFAAEALESTRSVPIDVRYLLVRVEDFATPDGPARRAAASRLLRTLDLPAEPADVDRAAAVFDVPMDAPADFLTSHYGRWRALPAEEQRRWFDAARPGLDAFGYVYDVDAPGMIGRVRVTLGFEASRGLPPTQPAIAQPAVPPPAAAACNCTGDCVGNCTASSFGEVRKVAGGDARVSLAAFEGFSDAELVALFATGAMVALAWIAGCVCLCIPRASLRGRSAKVAASAGARVGAMVQMLRERRAKEKAEDDPGDDEEEGGGKGQNERAGLLWGAVKSVEMSSVGGKKGSMFSRPLHAA